MRNKKFAFVAFWSDVGLIADVPACYSFAKGNTLMSAIKNLGLQPLSFNAPRMVLY